MLSCRAPERRHSLRWHGRTRLVYRVSREFVRETWRRDSIDLIEIEATASAALAWLTMVVWNARVRT